MQFSFPSESVVVTLSPFIKTPAAGLVTLKKKTQGLSQDGWRVAGFAYMDFGPYMVLYTEYTFILDYASRQDFHP